MIVLLWLFISIWMQIVTLCVAPAGFRLGQIIRQHFLLANDRKLSPQFERSAARSAGSLARICSGPNNRLGALASRTEIQIGTWPPAAQLAATWPHLWARARPATVWRQLEAVARRRDAWPGRLVEQ